VAKAAKKGRQKQGGSGTPHPTKHGGNASVAGTNLPEHVPETRRGWRRKGQDIPATFRPKFIEDLDQRNHATREVRRRFDLLKRDSGAESYQSQLICEHAAFLSLILSTAEAEALQTGKLDVGSFVQALNSLTGLLKAVGLHKRAKAVGLDDYLGAKAG
jgi:hypothetical protein